MSCRRAQEFLAHNRITIIAQTSTKERTFAEPDAQALIKDIDIIYSAKGKKVVAMDLKRSRPAWSEIALLLIGPTGKLRAPVIRKGKTLIVGFNESTYAELLG
jgi:arsenate reductase-like glutaredoxin family protein